jgi:hypothetical protein
MGYYMNRCWAFSPLWLTQCKSALPWAKYFWAFSPHRLTQCKSVT